MVLERYYIPPGMFTSCEELMNTPGTPDGPPGIWKRYEEGKCYISIWHSEEGLQWGYFSLGSFQWAIEKGYRPFLFEGEEVMI